MFNIKILCVGKLKEKFYSDAVSEYLKRLSGYCRLEIEELAETYGEQLNIYALACEKIFNKPVKQKLIYSFKFDRETEVE